MACGFLSTDAVKSAIGTEVTATPLDNLTDTRGSSPAELGQCDYRATSNGAWIIELQMSPPAENQPAADGPFDKVDVGGPTAWEMKQGLLINIYGQSHFLALALYPDDPSVAPRGSNQKLLTLARIVAQHA